MNILKFIVKGFKREAKSGVSIGAPRAGAVPLWFSNDSSAMSVATVFRCVKLLSESVANLPLQYLKLKEGIFVEAADHRLDYLLNVQPDYAINAFDFWRQVAQELLLDGNAYIVPVYSMASMELERLALCGRGTVSHDTINDCYDVNDINNGIVGHYTESQIIHIKGLTLRNSKRGVSVLTYARLTTSIASIGDNETQNRFANGGNVRGYVSNEKGVRGFGDLQQKQLELLAESIGSQINSGEKIFSIPGQVDFTQLSLSSVDMEFLATRKFTVIELCRFFSVPPSFVYADTSSNYKSVEQADVDFLSHTLNPMLRNIETELRRKLIPQSFCHKYKFRFDRRELFACDLNGMMEYRTKMLQIGATVNEVRRMGDLPPVDGADKVLVSANLRNIDELGVKQQLPDKNKDNNNENNEE